MLNSRVVSIIVITEENSKKEKVAQALVSKMYRKINTV